MIPKHEYLKLKPLHINASSEDFEGNGGIGRYVFLVGCASRAEKIAQQFHNLKQKKHPRGHTLHTGHIESEHGNIDVAVISTGMGAASTDIIFHELCILGAKRFLRVGTAGSLQPHYIKIGDVVIATAAVRDEATSGNYIMLEFPATASIEMMTAALTAARNSKNREHIHAGIVHSKDSFYAREIKCSFMNENKDYMTYLKKAGVLVSEMECSIVFTLSSVIGFHLSEGFNVPHNKIISGAILAVVGTDECEAISDTEKAAEAIESAIELAFNTFKALYKEERLFQVQINQ
ncbi:MAG: nucleoside phosphorylase [Gammaproteobacteria bacterium]|jgi:uridine phosphorylase